MAKVIRLDKNDNVLVALANLTKTELLPFEGGMLEMRDTVGRMHKIAAGHIKDGDPIVKYGQVIGFAKGDIGPGEQIHVHNCVVGDVEKDYAPCSLAKPTEFVEPAKQATFKGYRRPSGKVGTRNYIGVLTTVNCSATVAHYIAKAFAGPEALADYPNVDGIVALGHETGCGMRTEGAGYDVLRRTFEGFVRHPNFGGVLLVGLGCESMQVQRLLEESGLENSETFLSYTIQDVGGTRKSIEKGIDALKTLLPKVNAEQRTECPASELTLAVQCGGSDAFSGITANPALGAASDLLVKNGGSVIYSETPEIFGAEHLLTQRAQTPEIADKLLERISWWEEYTRSNGFELNNNPSPGNKEGGLTTILEKSLGAQAKGGSTVLTDVLHYGELLKTNGLVFMDSPGFDPVSVTGQVASGANVICFTTGRGSAFGFKPVPCLKLSSNTPMYEHMKEDMDINCGSILDDGESIEESGERIFQKVLAVASGEMSQSELLGYGDNEFNPWKIGAVV
ncbi:altronate hydrolase [Alteromonadaceae bacterium Bs31]|nr:altronate hydrolase [Alteromonadaceae bacterium Bs31]